MSRGKRIKYLMFVGLALTLASSLVAGACAPAAPTGGEGAAEIAALEAEVADLEGDVSAEKAKAKKLQGEIDALKKPAKVYRWEPATWISAGMSWDGVVYWSNHLNALSDGRIVATPTAPGAVCPVEEQAEAVGAGTTGAMMPTMSYYAGKFEEAAIYNTSIGVRSCEDQMYAYEYFENGRVQEIMFDAIEERYNVKAVATSYSPVQAIMSITVPVERIADLDGLKFRCGDDHFAGPFNELGVATVWAPGTEIYTMLATGVVDGFTYGSSADHYAQSFHEVTSYWVDNSIMPSMNEIFLINMDVWNELPEDLQYLCLEASDAVNVRRFVEGLVNVDQAWVDVVEYGIVRVHFPDEDMAIWTELQLDYLTQYEVDPEAGEMVALINAFARMKGYIE